MARLARPGWPRVLALAGAWVLADLARQFVLTGFPWNPWGSVWEIPGPVGDVFIQPAALGRRARPDPGDAAARRDAGTRLAVARRRALRCSPPGSRSAVWRLQQTVPPQALTVVLVQGNVAQGQKFDQALVVQNFRHYLDLTFARPRQPAPAVAVWPETAFPGLLDLDEPARQAIEQATEARPR